MNSNDATFFIGSSVAKKGIDADDDAILRPTIVTELCRFLKRFVFLRFDELYTLVALWVAATHLYRHFGYTGYLVVTSPEYQSGKSRLLEVIKRLVHQPSDILVSPTEAVLFRTAEDGTQLLDEVDSWLNGETLRGILNAGFENGSSVSRLNKDEKGYAVQKFGVYCPRAFAGIGDKILSETTKDRSFIIRMARQKQGERRERFRREALKDGDVCKKELAKWCADNKDAIVSKYEQADFPYLEKFRDRTIDIAEPLAAILEVAYAGHPLLAEQRFELMKAIELTRQEEQSPARAHIILRKLLELAQEQEDDLLIGSASELAARCSNLEDAPNEYSIADVLTQYNFKPKSTRLGGQPRKRYSLSKAELTDIVDRYAPKQPNASAG